MMASATGAFLAGLVGRWLAEQKLVFLVGRIAQVLPPQRHVPFLCDLWAHSASYLVGFLGGAGLAWSVWRSRAGSAAPSSLSDG